MTALRQPSGLSPKMLKEAFSLSANADTDMEDDGAGEYFLVHVDKILPPALPDLSDPKLREAVSNDYGLHEVVQRMRARADELVQRVHKGEKFEAVAASAGLPVKHVAAVSRQAMANSRSLSPELVETLFAAKAGEVFTGVMPPSAIMIGKIDAVHPAAPVIAAPMAVAASGQLAQPMFQGFQQSLRAAARSAIKPKIYPDRAIAELGLSPDDLPKPPANPKTKGLAQ